MLVPGIRMVLVCVSEVLPLMRSVDVGLEVVLMVQVSRKW